MKSKRLYLEVRWSKSRGWHVVNRAAQQVVVWNGRRMRGYETKVLAVSMAGAYCNSHRPSERVVYNKNGRIAKGSIGRSTYGADPEKTRG